MFTEGRDNDACRKKKVVLLFGNSNMATWLICLYHIWNVSSTLCNGWHKWDYYTRNPASLDFFFFYRLRSRHVGRGQSSAARSRTQGRRRENFSVSSVGNVSIIMAKQLIVANMVEERAMWSGGNIPVACSLLQYTYVALFLYSAVLNDVRWVKF